MLSTAGSDVKAVKSCSPLIHLNGNSVLMQQVAHAEGSGKKNTLSSSKKLNLAQLLPQRLIMFSHWTQTLVSWVEVLDLAPSSPPQPPSFDRPCGFFYYTVVLAQKAASTSFIRIPEYYSSYDILRTVNEDSLQQWFQVTA